MIATCSSLVLAVAFCGAGLSSALRIDYADLPLEGSAPESTADCEEVPGINTGIIIVYDASCPGLGCFESYPCRYCTDETKDYPECMRRPDLQHEDAKPKNTADCQQLPGINTALNIVYDASCPGLGCFESYPCRYCTGWTQDYPECAKKPGLEQQPKPHSTAECQKVLGINTAVSIVYDASCPGLGCFESYPCRYCISMTKDYPKCKNESGLAQQDLKPKSTADCRDVPGINTSLCILYDENCPGLGCFESYPCRYCTTNRTEEAERGGRLRADIDGPQDLQGDRSLQQWGTDAANNPQNAISHGLGVAVARVVFGSSESKGNRNMREMPMAEANEPDNLEGNIESYQSLREWVMSMESESEAGLPTVPDAPQQTNGQVARAVFGSFEPEGNNNPKEGPMAEASRFEEPAAAEGEERAAARAGGGAGDGATGGEATAALLQQAAVGVAPASRELFGHTGGACWNDLGCSLNGECRAGRCVCDAAWSGSANCSVLALLPAKRRGGYGHVNSSTSSWGAGVVYDPVSKKYVMVAEEMDMHCGLQTWKQNSRCVVAASDTVDGQYDFQGVAVDAWAHSCTPARDPVSGTWIVTHTRRARHPRRTGCRGGCSKGTTRAARDTVPCSGGDHDFEEPITSGGPNGPWRQSKGLFAAIGGGLEPWFLPNGTLLSISNRGTEVGRHKTTIRPSIIRAESLQAALEGNVFRLPWRSVLAGTDQAFSDDESKWPQIWWEDHHIFTDKRGNFHILAHAWSAGNTTYPQPGCRTRQPASAACRAYIGHAFSHNAMDWYISPVAAATGETTFEDGETVRWRARERPHVVQNKKGELLALITGVGDPHCAGGNTGMVGCDHTFTLVQRVRR